MTEPVDTAALRALAKAAFDANGGIPMWWTAEFIEDRGWMDRADAEFVEATKPTIVIALCDEIDSLRGPVDQPVDQEVVTRLRLVRAEFAAKLPTDSSPYPSGLPRRTQWTDGYHAAIRDVLELMDGQIAKAQQ